MDYNDTNRGIRLIGVKATGNKRHGINVEGRNDVTIIGAETHGNDGSGVNVRESEHSDQSTKNANDDANKSVGKKVALKILILTVGTALAAITVKLVVHFVPALAP